ncbi:MAG: hypothetical protein GY835_04540 [bacterium]|nr:hypothetical protein [bacterium]
MANEELLKELLGDGKKREFDLGIMMRTVWRKKHLILIPFILSWIIAAVGLQYIPATYLAASSVAIENSSNFTRELELLIDDGASHRQDVSELAKVRAEIRNQEFLNRVIEALDLGRTPIIREQARQLVDGPLHDVTLQNVINRLAAEEIRKRLDVRFGSAGVYNIRTESHSAENAYILNKVITQLYVEDRRQRELAEITAKGDFSDEQVVIYKEKLYRAEQELERFRTAQQQTESQGNPVSADNVIMAQEVMNSYSEELSGIEVQVGGFRVQLRSTFGVLPSSERLLNDSTLRTLENKQIHTMLQNLVAYLAGRQRANDSLTEFIEDASVGRDRQGYREQLISLVGQIYTSESPRQRELIVGYYYRLMLMSGFQEIVDTLNRYVSNFRNNLSGSPAIEAELIRRESEVERAREFLDAFQQQSTSTQITRDIQSNQLAARIEVRDQAIRPLRPIKPNRPRLQIVFILIGLLTGLATVFLSEFFNRSYSRIEEIEEDLGVSVLGTIPPMAKGPGQAKIQKRKNMLVWALSMVMFVAVMVGMMFFLKNLHSRTELFMDRQAVEEIL